MMRIRALPKIFKLVLKSLQKQNCIYLARAKQNQRLEGEKHAAWAYVSGSSENLSRSDGNANAYEG